MQTKANFNGCNTGFLIMQLALTSSKVTGEFAVLDGMVNARVSTREDRSAMRDGIKPERWSGHVGVLRLVDVRQPVCNRHLLPSP